MQRAMPLESVAAVHYWNLVVYVVTAYVKRFLLAPVCRHADDLFGCSRVAVFWSGSRCLDVITTLAGLPLDQKKSKTDMMSLDALGGHG